MSLDGGNAAHIEKTIVDFHLMSSASIGQRWAMDCPRIDWRGAAEFGCAGELLPWAHLCRQKGQTKELCMANE
jgi:hypothetical protein